MSECSGHSEEIVQLPREILAVIFRTLPTLVVVHRVGAVCKDWHSIVKDDELWRLRSGLAELPPAFSSWFAYVQRQTMGEQALDHLYGRAGVTQNWRKGLQLLSVLADAGDDYAMALYGWALWLGFGIREDIQNGVHWLLQSKHLTARTYCLLNGTGMDQDTGEAYRLLSTECDTSDLHVQYLLGLCHQWGFGCTKDIAHAARCYERAGNHIGALSNLATLLEHGDRPKADRCRAVALFRHAATQGVASTQFHLGYCYEQGIPGVLKKDIAQAKHWYSLCAEQGYDFAIAALEGLNDALEP